MAIKTNSFKNDLIPVSKSREREIDPFSASKSTVTTVSEPDKGSNIPIVYINKIMLDTVSSSTTIDDSSTEILSVNFEMQLKIPANNSLFDTQADILKYLGIQITRTTDSGTISIYKGNLENITSLGTSFLGEISLLTSGDPIIVQDGSISPTYYLPFQINDRLQTPVNLTYQAQCYLDLDEMAASLGIDFSVLGSSLETTGPISSEVILSDGKVKTMADIYIVTSAGDFAGTIWNGPIIVKTPDGPIVSAMYSGSSLTKTTPVLDLQKAQIRNSKIQDMRILNQLSSLNIDLTSQDFFPITVKGTNTYNNSIKNPDAYISNAFLSRDLHNNCRFMFEFDYNKFLIEGSKFGKILTNPFVPEATKQKIYLYSKITNLEITRRQVDLARTSNRLNSPILGIHRSDISYENKIIARTASDPENYNFLEDRELYGPGITGDGERVIGRVAEMATIKDSPTTTRTISVTDNSARRLNGGAFQYGVRIEVEDGTVRFLNERLRRLQTVRNYLVEYYNVLQIPASSFNLENAAINISSVTEYYTNGSGSITEEIRGLQLEKGITVGSLGSLGVNSLFPWIVAPQYFIDTMETISDFGSKTVHIMRDLSTVRRSSSDLYDTSSKTSKGPPVAIDNIEITSSTVKYTDLFDEKTALFSFESLLQPNSATPETVMNVIGAFDILVQKIRTMMGASAEINTFTNLTPQVGSSKAARVSVLKLQDYFVEIFDAELSQMPAADRIGFVGSPGYINPVIAPSPKISFANGSKINSFQGPQKDQGSDDFPGPLALTSDEWNMRLDDEVALYDESCVVELTGIGPSELDPDSKASKQSEFRERRLALQKERVDARKRTQPQAPKSAGSSPAAYLSVATIDSRKGQVIERPSNIVTAWDPQQYIRMQNTIVATSTGDFSPSSFTNQDTINHTMNKLGIEVRSQTTPMAVQVSLEAGSQKNKDSLLSAGVILGPADPFVPGFRNTRNNECYEGGNGDGSTNLEMCKNETNAQPITQTLMNIVAENGSLNQVIGKANGNATTAAKIFSPSGKSVIPSAAKKSLTGDSDSSALPSQITGILKGMSAGILNPSTGNFSQRYAVEDLAAVQIFRGYETDTAGNIMIKKPVWHTPNTGEWVHIIRELKNSEIRSESYGAILCRFEPMGDSNGLNLIYTNTYFIITRNEASLFLLPPPVFESPIYTGGSITLGGSTAGGTGGGGTGGGDNSGGANIDLFNIPSPEDLGIESAVVGSLVDPNQPSGTTFLDN